MTPHDEAILRERLRTGCGCPQARDLTTAVLRYAENRRTPIVVHEVRATNPARNCGETDELFPAGAVPVGPRPRRETVETVLSCIAIVLLLIGWWLA